MDSMRKRILISTLGILTLVAILAGLLGVIDSIAKSGPVAPSPGPSNANLKSLTGLSLPKIDISRLKGLADLLAKIDPSVLKNLTNLLAKIDTSVLKNLANLLGKIDPSVLKNLTNLLSKIDPSALKSLTELLSKIDPSSLKNLADLLGKMDPSNLKDLASLASGLKIDPSVLQGLADLLGKMDPSSLQDLASLLGKMDPSSLQDLASLLGKMDPGTLQDLASVLGKTDPGTLQDLANFFSDTKTDPSSLKDLANLLGGTEIDPKGLSGLDNLFSSLYGKIGADTPDLSSLEDGLSGIPLFKISGAANTSLLRTGVITDLNGDTWKVDSSAKQIPYNGEEISSTVKDYSRKLTDTISVSPEYEISSGEFLVPTTLYSSSVSSSKPLDYLPDDHVFISEQGLPESYSFQSTQYEFDKLTLDNAKVDPVPDYLGLPSSTTQRTRQLAADITANLDSPYEKAKAIEKYLKDNYSYDTSYKRAPQGSDATDWFLFDEKKGDSSTFNLAFVTLARAAVIPSRLVSGFSIKPDAGEQEVLAGQAHVWSEVKFKDIGWITFDATGNPPKPLATTTSITSNGLVASKGHRLAIQGKVQAQGVTVEGLLVEIYINPNKSHEGGLLVGRGTVNQGAFNIEFNIPANQNVGSYQLLAHSRASSQFQESWSDPVIKINSVTQITLEVLPKVKQSEPVVIKGKLTEEFNKSVGGQTIGLAFNGRIIAQVTSAQDGQFESKQSFDNAGEYTLDATFSGTEYYLPSHQQVKFQVLTPTAIRLQVPQKANSQDAVLISGFLLEEKTGSAVSGQPVEILANGQSLTKQATDKDGQFTFKHTFSKAGIYQLEAKFPGASRYWESRNSMALQISASGGGATWIYPIILAAVLAGVAGGYFLYRRRQWRVLPAVATGVQTVEPLQNVPPEPEVKPSSGIKLNIEFPGIEPVLPDVWGVHESLMVLYRLADAHSLPMPAKPLRITIGEPMTGVNTDASGTVQLEHLFTDKGQYIFVAEYNSGTDVESTSRTVRIVDYREEIVDLYKGLKDWFRQIGITLDQDATPRELEEIVTKSGKGVSPTALSRVVNCFEEANYSLHPVQREHYKIMYLAQQEIRKYERQPVQTQTA